MELGRWKCPRVQSGAIFEAPLRRSDDQSEIRYAKNKGNDWAVYNEPARWQRETVMALAILANGKPGHRPADLVGVFDC